MSRRFSELAPYISSQATEQVARGRNLVTELNDPASVGWPTLERLLTLGGRVSRWPTGPSFCAPGTFATWASLDEAQAFRQGVDLDTLWAVAVPTARVFAAPSDNAKVIAVAGHELVAMTNAAGIDAANAADRWVTVRWDRTPAYLRRTDVHGPDDPGLCLDRANGSWQITSFRTENQ
jgi:hypothetical protein